MELTQKVIYQTNSKLSESSYQSLGANSNNKNKINPWDDERTFIQDVGELEGFLNFVQRGDKLNENFQNEFEQVDQSCFDIDNTTDNHYLLDQLNKISKLNFEKLKTLEIIYEKYRSESILSKTKNDELCYDIGYLIQIFEKIESNKTKLGNLIHNTHLSESNIIKIKHEYKFEFIKIMKRILTQVDTQNISQRNDIELIKLSSNLHPETINKIVSLKNILSLY